MAIFLGRRHQEIMRRLDRIERKLDELMVHLEVPQKPEPEWMADVRALVIAGRKIEAIKAYRERTGAGLYDAKQAVDGM
jgi:ribosomal protein L7/L12